MRKPVRLLIVEVCTAMCVTADLPAQMHDYCLITYSGENHQRVINADANINAECGGDGHSAPFGNWGVTSNYGKARDANQFAGWHKGKVTGTGRSNWQWNSCTTHIKYAPPNPAYYNDNGYTSQRSTRGLQSYGEQVHRIPLPCQGDPPIYPLPSLVGCTASSVPSSWSINNNFMSLYELDWNGKTLVTTLCFPKTTVKIKSCNYWGCIAGVSKWEDVSSSTNPGSKVDSQMRMSVTVTYDHGCAW